MVDSSPVFQPVYEAGPGGLELGKCGRLIGPIANTGHVSSAHTCVLCSGTEQASSARVATRETESDRAVRAGSERARSFFLLLVRSLFLFIVFLDRTLSYLPEEHQVGFVSFLISSYLRDRGTHPRGPTPWASPHSRSLATSQAASFRVAEGVRNYNKVRAVASILLRQCPWLDRRVVENE